MKVNAYYIRTYMYAYVMQGLTECRMSQSEAAEYNKLIAVIAL